MHSPTYLASRYDADGVALVHPAKLAWGLRQACLDLGVRIYEHTEVTKITSDGAGLALRCPFGSIRGRQVALATNAFTNLLRRLGNYIVPVYDYVLVTEPLSPEQQTPSAGRSAGAWLISAISSTTTGSRPTTGSCGADTTSSTTSATGSVPSRISGWPHAALAEQFFTTFPQLEGLRFTHRWGGVIDTCSRFTTFWGRAYRDRLAYAVGYTGLGVGASRFGARVMLDLLDGADNERTRLTMVRPSQSPSHPSPSATAGSS